MKTRESHIVCISVFAFLGLLQSATAQLTYVTNNGAITITGFSTASLSVTIPTVINGYPVTTIGTAAFNGDLTMTSVTIPNSVTNIESFAFTDSGLNAVTIPGSVIGIGVEAFAACQSLTYISVVPTNPAYSSLNGVLFDKAHYTLIQYPAGLATAGGSYTVPDGALTIGDYAFYEASGFASVTIPSSVISIGSDSFAYCGALNNPNLTVYFGGNAPSVGFDAFYDDGSNGKIVAYYLPGTTGWAAFSSALGSSLASLSFWYLPAPEALNFEPSFGVHSNRFGFTISWATNASVVVEACSNLANPVWLPISTNNVTAATGTANFTDPNWMGYRVRGYRLVSP